MSKSFLFIFQESKYRTLLCILGSKQIQIGAGNTHQNNWRNRLSRFGFNIPFGRAIWWSLLYAFFVFFRSCFNLFNEYFIITTIISSKGAKILEKNVVEQRNCKYRVTAWEASRQKGREEHGKDEVRMSISNFSLRSCLSPLSCWIDYSVCSSSEEHLGAWKRQ